MTKLQDKKTTAGKHKQKQKQLLPVPERLPDHSVIKIIGLGGVGGIIARYLSVFLASLLRPMRLVLIDGDTFEPSNTSRMCFRSCGNKATVIHNELIEYFMESELSLIAIEQYVATDNIHSLIHENDFVILAVDNHQTRHIVNEFCTAKRNNVRVFSGGNDGVGKDSSGRYLRGTFGNCQIYIRNDGHDVSPSLSKFHPEINNPGDKLEDEKSCTELISSVPQILFTNLMTASAILNAFWLYTCGSLHYSETIFDIAEGRMKPAAIPAPDL